MLELLKYNCMTTPFAFMLGTFRIPVLPTG